MNQSLIHFESNLVTIGPWIIVKLPQSASDKLPSRGMVMVEGTINDAHFQAPLEPDGKKSHWLRIDKKIQQSLPAKVGDKVTLAIEPSKEWPEPEVPSDLQKALADIPPAKNFWQVITPMARWDWIRWIGATKNPDTRQRRIEVACSKLKAGSRRPCCFNRTECTDPTVSHNGVLLSE